MNYLPESRLAGVCCGSQQASPTRANRAVGRQVPSKGGTTMANKPGLRARVSRRAASPTPAPPAVEPAPAVRAESAASGEEPDLATIGRQHARLLREINTRLAQLEERVDTRFYHLEQRVEMRSRQLAQQIQDGFEALVMVERRINWLSMWLLVAAGIMVAAGGGLTWFFRLLGFGGPQ